MKIKDNYNHTLNACYFGYITQAIVNNFAPLLFLTFQKSYEIPLNQISLLITINFGVQLLVDFLSAHFVDKIGYRICMVAAHLFGGMGLIAMAVLPSVLPAPFFGLLTGVILYAVGGGLIEVLVSPIVEACPTEKKEAAMSLLHSFYCWGYVGVVLCSTLFFAVFGIRRWQILAVVWAVLPLLNAVYFSQVPIRMLSEETEGLRIGKLVRLKYFWIMMLLMICAGASEQSVSQWASAFAESGLGVSKMAGDLAGPCAFALLMGLSRILTARFSEKFELEKIMFASGMLCIISYLMITLSSNPVISLAGCALSGFSVGALWPGTFSLAARRIPGGGTAMFAFFALSGDVGCAAGPALVGLVSGAFYNDLKMGIMAALIFPALLVGGILSCRRNTAAELEKQAAD